MTKILFKQELAEGIKLIKIEAPLIARKAQAGQFVVIRVDEKSERIPLTIANLDPESITLIFQEVGAATTLLGRLNEGDSIQDLLGPLGQPAEIKKFGTAVCIGGGVGIAEIFPVARALKEAGNQVISIIGARNKSLLFFENEIRAVSQETFITTDDGSGGQKGFVSDILKQLISEGRKIDLVSAVGPLPMMRVVSELTRPPKISTRVSLNPLMLDATGMCGVCRVSVGGEVRFACVDGPEFDAHRVDFDELGTRLKTYLTEEKRALEHVCRIG